MIQRYDDLRERFKAKGFRSSEIQGLLIDILGILDEGGHSTMAYFNRELEDLGWGVDIVDDDTYRLITPALGWPHHASR